MACQVHGPPLRQTVATQHQGSRDFRALPAWHWRADPRLVRRLHFYLYRAPAFLTARDWARGSFARSCIRVGIPPSVCNPLTATSIGCSAATRAASAASREREPVPFSTLARPLHGRLRLRPFSELNCELTNCTFTNSTLPIRNVPSFCCYLLVLRA